MEPSPGHQLRPRTIGELLDLTFQVYTRRFWMFAAIGAIVSLSSLLPALVWQAAFGQVMGEAQSTGETTGVLLPLAVGVPLVLLVYIAIYSYGSMAVTAIVDDELHRRPCSLRSSLASARSRMLAAAGTSILCSILTLLGLAVCCFVCCIPAVAVATVLILAVPLVYLERLSPTAAMQRSWELIVKRGPGGLSTEANWVRVLLVAIVVFVVYYILSLLAQLPVLSISLFSVLRGVRPTQTPFGPQLVPLAVLLPLQVVCAMIQGLFLAIVIIPWPLLYYDIRIRHEGLDLETTAERLGMAEAPRSTPPEPEPRA